MNKDIFKGKWNEIKGKVKQEWGNLTDDDLQTMEGKYDELVGKLQKRYGYDREEAEKNVNTFIEQNKIH